MRTFIITLELLFLGGSSFLFAQGSTVYFGLGGWFRSFQNTRFSDVHFNKATVLPELGFSLVKHIRIEINFISITN